MKITLKIDAKELSRIIAGLNKIISDNEYILKSNNLPIDTMVMIEKNIHETEKLKKYIVSAHAAQTLQYKPKEDKKTNGDN